MTAGVRILLIDDERTILEIFSNALRGLGYYVKEAASADDAISLMTRERFDIAFLDQFLGPIRGLDVMERMQNIDPELSYVIMTANGDADLAVQSLKKGASDFITKPFLVADLVRSIDYANKKRQLDDKKKEVIASLESTVREKTEELEGMYFSVLSALAQAVEKKDLGTYGHCRRVSFYSRLIAIALDLDEASMRDLNAASMLHDIGKIGISDSVLAKPGPLNEDERNIIKEHPSRGVEILRPIKQFGPILPAILHHHENYDGSGYPLGLSRENIPMFARIIAVADSYDAIMSVRPYRSKRGHEIAMQELSDNAGKQFDPFIIDSFAKADARYYGLFGTRFNNERDD